MAGYVIKPLTMGTWPAFAALVERHNGVWGGCWCMAFHAEGGERGTDHRGQKEQRVREDRAHAALVFDGELCVGWCQFGSPEELPRIKFGKAYREGAAEPPNWRITSFFVDKAYRHKGVAAAALKGALSQIAALGGGIVESSPEDVEGRKVSNSFLYNATLAIFEEQGFVPTRQLGKNNWLVSKKVRARRAPLTRERLQVAHVFAARMLGTSLMLMTLPLRRLAPIDHLFVVKTFFVTGSRARVVAA